MPKSIGIVRRLDSLGRLVIPMETRKTFQIEPGDNLEFFVDGETIILKKYQPGCIFCGNVNDVKSHKDKLVCQSCISELS